MIEREKAYLAGILDTKGFIKINKEDIGKKQKQYPRYRGSLKIVHKHYSALKLIQYFYGGKIRNKTKSSYELVYYGEDGCHILRDVLPYLLNNRTKAQIYLDLMEIKNKEIKNAEDYEEQKQLFLKFQLGWDKYDPKIIEEIKSKDEDLILYYLGAIVDFNFNFLIHACKNNTVSFNCNTVCFLTAHLQLFKDYFIVGRINKRITNTYSIEYEDIIPVMCSILEFTKIRKDIIKEFISLLKIRVIGAERIDELLLNYRKLNEDLKEIEKNIEFFKCPDCELLKTKSEFYLRRDGEIRCYCKDCCLKAGSDYYKNNTEKCKQNNKNYKKKNPEKRKEIERKPKTRLKMILRNRIVKIMKGCHKKGFSKSLGCDNSFFIKYIESQFRDGMTWENYGIVWELDHIKPLSYFNLEIKEHFDKANHYTNLQPLLKQENADKSDFLPNGKRGRDIK